MQKTTQSFTFLLLLSIIMLISCNQDNDCDGTFEITSVLPNNNPAGTEVSIKGSGFSKDTEVRFGGQLAESDFSNEKGLVAIVPNNVSGLVDLTVEQENCLARSEFEILGTLPNNWVTASPVIIVIPAIPATAPSNINNKWINYYDRNHSIQLIQSSFLSCGDFDGTTGKIVSEQDLSGSLENHATNNALKNNPVTGIYKCHGSISISIDRTGNGGAIERWNGVVVTPASIGINDNDLQNKKLLLFNSTAGRQYVFFTE